MAIRVGKIRVRNSFWLDPCMNESPGDREREGGHSVMVLRRTLLVTDIVRLKTPANNQRLISASACEKFPKSAYQ